MGYACDNTTLETLGVDSWGSSRSVTSGRRWVGSYRYTGVASFPDQGLYTLNKQSRTLHTGRSACNAVYHYTVDNAWTICTAIMFHFLGRNLKLASIGGVALCY